jgi:outer membrane protein OmpA-like peptidoglycan-associated protein
MAQQTAGLRVKSLGALSAVALVLSGCVQSTAADPNANRTRDGAIVGAMLGGFLGATRDGENSRRDTVIGAAAGAAIGAGIGSMLDRQAADLRAQMDNENIMIQNTGEELIVTLPEGILFDTDSAAIRAMLQSDLRTLAQNLQTYPDTTVDVIGHTDNTGSSGYNMDLSSRRASAVAGVLLEEGVAPWRVRSFGRGETEPVASNLTPEGRQQNRRVEIFIRPSTQ